MLMMHADSPPRIRASGRLLVPLALVLAACSAAPSPSPLPEVPPPPEGWTSLGAVQGETSPGWAVSRLTFSGRAVAVNASCRGTGTLFVIVGWADVSPRSAPAEFKTSAFPCRSPIEGAIATRIELTTAPTGDADVNVFVVEGAGAIGRSSFGVSIEEREP
jgi:hypothetical protein